MVFINKKNCILKLFSKMVFETVTKQDLGDVCFLVE